MQKFKQWYMNNYVKITWFLIGFLTMSAFVDFGRGNYLEAFISIAIAWLNYVFVKNEL
jgi:hypothetical protein